MKKKVGIIKRAISLLLVFLLSISSFAAVVSDNDGSAFITKAEFDSLKNTFQTQIDQYSTSIDSKIDGAIANYLAGIRVNSTESIDPYMGKTLSFSAGLSTSTTAYPSTFQSFYGNFEHAGGVQEGFFCADSNGSISLATVMWGSRDYGYGYCMGSEPDGIVSVAAYDASKMYKMSTASPYCYPVRFFWVVDDINSTAPVCLGLACFTPNVSRNMNGAMVTAGGTGLEKTPFIAANTDGYYTYWEQYQPKPMLKTETYINKNTATFTVTGRYASCSSSSGSSKWNTNSRSFTYTAPVFQYGNPDGTYTRKDLGNKTNGLASHYWNYENQMNNLWCCGSYGNPCLWTYDNNNYVNWTLNTTYTFHGSIYVRLNNPVQYHNTHTKMTTGKKTLDFHDDIITMYGMDADTYLQDLVAKPYQNLQDYGSHYWDGAILFKSPANGKVTITLKSGTSRTLYFQKEPFTNASSPTTSKLVPFKVNGGSTTYTNSFTASAGTTYKIEIENILKNEKLYIKPNGTTTLTIDDIIIEKG